MKTLQFTPYLATAYAEGFCEGENATASEQLQAWAYLVKTGTCWGLQGWFGRTAAGLIEQGYLTSDGDLTDMGREATEADHEN